MPKFTARYASGKTEEVSYTPLMVIAGSEVHKLALHKDQFGHWVVSHPGLGFRVCTVCGPYKGIRVSSKGIRVSRTGITKKEILMQAQSDVDSLIIRVGSEKFNDTIAKGKHK